MQVPEENLNIGSQKSWMKHSQGSMQTAVVTVLLPYGHWKVFLSQFD